jgi:hypothetical protein
MELPQKIKDSILERKRESRRIYVEKHKKLVNDKNKEYYEKNKELINEKRRAAYKIKQEQKGALIEIDMKDLLYDA